MHPTATPIRPLLKWAGGKRQLLPALLEHAPPSFSRYFEPFLGSGAVFFHLAAEGLLADREAWLADVNADLIGCYRAVRDRTDDVVAELKRLDREYRANGSDCYYDVRDRRFNPRRARLFADLPDEAVAASYPADLAAMLLFLNRTGFNGLFRLNRRGEFNVPAGRYTDPKICDPAHIAAVAETLRRPGIALDYRPFDKTMAMAGEGDFVYCDPPYAPLSRTASFANYTADGFSAFDQRRLQQAVVAASQRGASVVVSNSSAPEIVAGYSSRDARSARLVVRRVPARRAINSRASARGAVDELIISNVRTAALAAVKPRMLDAQARGRKRKSA
jgi:DNA adenine methylase